MLASTNGNSLWGITSNISSAAVIGDTSSGEGIVARQSGTVCEANLGSCNGIGAVVGMGIWTYELLAGGTQETALKVEPEQRPHLSLRIGEQPVQLATIDRPRAAPSTPALVWMPLVSLTW